jgi:PAS domain S-box-containing protein
VHDARDAAPAVGERALAAWEPAGSRPGDGVDVAVLLLDTRRGLVTYANPDALAITGGRAQLPTDAATWTAAARLVLPGGPSRGGGEQAVPVVDPVAVVAAGGAVPGMRLEITGDDGALHPYWFTGSQLLSASGVTGGSAIVALFPVPVPQRDRRGPAHKDPVAELPERGLPLAGANGAAITRADAAARSAVADATRGVLAGAPDLAAADLAAADLGAALEFAALPTGGDVDELTARALIASSISFTISDPRQPDDPLVWVNPAFERMTGYRADESVGRNCRMLQGPGTDRAAVARLREALQRGEGVRAELLNYRKDGSPFWNSFTISPVLDGEGRLTHFVGVQTDVTARVIAGIEYERLLAAERDARGVAERASDRLDVIVEIGAVLSETLDAGEGMRRLADTLVPRVADYCIVDLVDRPVVLPVVAAPGGESTAPPEAVAVARDLLGSSHRVAVAHPEPDQAAALATMGAGLRRLTHRTLPVAALTGVDPVHRTDLSDTDYVAWAEGDEDLLEHARLLGTAAVIVAPMRARGRVIGALTLGRTHASGRRFDAEDVDLARTLAARAALAVDNALLLEAETEQRRRADALAAAGTALAASGLHSSDAVEVLLDHVVPALGDWAFVHVDEHASAALRPAGAGPGLQLVRDRHAQPRRAALAQAALRRWVAVAGTPGPGSAWSTRNPQVVAVDAALLADGAVADDARAVLGPLIGGSLVSVPLTVRGTTFGALTVAREQGPAFAGDEVRFVAELGHRLAIALDNARLYESERQVALELQRSLLPARLPRLAELDVAGRYLAGAAGAEVGGDWYDVIPLPGRRVAVAVGDVMGRGVRAAAVMGQLRAALRSYAVEGLPPGRMLEHLGAFTEVLDGEHLVTCLVGVHDAAAGTVTLASAGHPPPLRLGRDGVAGYVDVRPGLPLGVPSSLHGHDREHYEECTIRLEPDAALLMFTDGLVEDRDVPVGAGLERLAAAFAGQLPPDAESACEAALRAMGRDASHDDDTAVLALRATDMAPPGLPDGAPGDREQDAADDGLLRVDLHTVPQAPAAGRQAVTDVLLAAGMPGLVDTASLLVSELVTNALRHGGGPRELLVRVDEEGVDVGVRDSSPQAPHPMGGDGPGAIRVVDGGLAENGRGLLLVDLLSDGWGWRPESGGKLVWFRLRQE